MAGDNIRLLNKGMDSLLRTLRTDPHALETVYLSVIAFAGKAVTLNPLVELASFYLPRLPLGSGTSLGAALEHLMNEIDKSVAKSTPEVKGDWKPVVYLMTDGRPTDEPEGSIHKWKDRYANKATLVTIGIGQHADVETLRQLTENAFLLKAESEFDYMKFIQWMSQSVASHSRSLSSSPNEVLSLAKIDESVLKKVDDIIKAGRVDEDFVILTAKCQSSQLPYVMRYELVDVPGATSQLYNLNGVFALEADYFALSDDRVMARTVSTNTLMGSPGCPHCGNPIGFAVCACGGIHCLKSPGPAICPWCRKEGNYSIKEHLEVTRSRG